MSAFTRLSGAQPMKRLAIIPARGGSKRIPRKNIRLFAGKPIVAYSITTAQQTRLFDDIIVSTDDSEIASVARTWGASVPFLRSTDTSDDHATLANVLCEVLEECYSRGMTYDYVCCILATAPFVSPRILNEAYSQLLSSQSDSMVPVVRFSYPIQRALRLTSDHRLEMVEPRYLNTRSNDLEPRFHDAGQFYWIRAEAFLKNRGLFTSKTGAFVIDEMHAQDIDSEEDWSIAELKYRLLFDTEGK